jgi:penicillin amidase
MAQWRWDDFHRARFGHQVFAALPVLGRLAGREIGSPGGEYTINRGAYVGVDELHPLAHVHGPGLRAIYDLGDLAASRFALAGGQSGHLASPHYDDLLNPWRDEQYFLLAPTAGSNPPETRK